MTRAKPCLVSAGAIALLLLVACAHPNGELSTVVRRCADEAARRTDGGTVRVDQVIVDATAGTEPSQVAVRAHAEESADSWHTAAQAAGFGARLMTAAFVDPRVASVRLVFSEGGSPVVTVQYSRKDAEDPDLPRVLAVLANGRTNSEGWLPFFASSSSYRWLDHNTWDELTDMHNPDSVELGLFPESR